MEESASARRALDGLAAIATEMAMTRGALERLRRELEYSTKAMVEVSE